MRKKIRLEGTNRRMVWMLASLAFSLTFDSYADCNFEINPISNSELKTDYRIYESELGEGNAILSAQNTALIFGASNKDFYLVNTLTKKTLFQTSESIVGRYFGKLIEHHGEAFAFISHQEDEFRSLIGWVGLYNVAKQNWVWKLENFITQMNTVEFNSSENAIVMVGSKTVPRGMKRNPHLPAPKTDLENQQVKIDFDSGFISLLEARK